MSRRALVQWKGKSNDFGYQIETEENLFEMTMSLIYKCQSKI